MNRVVFVGAAPELAHYVRFLLSHHPSRPEVVVAKNEIEGYVAASEQRTDLVIVDEDLPLFGAPGLRALLSEEPRTWRTPVLFLTGEDPERIAVSSHLRRFDRILAKPFGAAAFQEALAPHPRARRARRAAAAWLREQFCLRFDLERYTRGQVAAALLLLLGIVASAAAWAPAQLGSLHLTAPRLILWGGFMLMVSLAAHLRDRHLRWESLLFSKFAFMVSILPPGAVETAQRVLSQAA